MVLHILIGWYFYLRVQVNYPTPGLICRFGRQQLECMVISNHWRNKATVLRVQDAAWNGAYIVLTYCWIYRFWPTLTWGIIDTPNTTITRGYVMSLQEMYPTPLVYNKSLVSAVSVSREMVHFNALVKAWKPQWFQPPHGFLSFSDWLVTTIRLNHAAHCIQNQWRKCVSCPLYTICCARLANEFSDLERLMSQECNL